MRRYSAAEAIGPSLEHAKQWLFLHSNWKTYLKLATVASLAGVFSATFNYRSQNRRFGGMHGQQTVQSPLHWGAVALVPLILAFIVAGLILFYVSIRMKFVLVNALATRRREIRPIWDLYASATWQWIGLTVALGLVVLALLVPVFLAFRHAELGTAGAGLQIVLSFLAILVMAVVAWILRDFVLPVMALEGASIGGGWDRAMSTLRAEPGEFFLYFLLKVILTFVLLFARIFTILIAGALAAIPFVIVGAVPFFFLRHAGLIGISLCILFACILTLFYLVVAICLAFAISGPISAFFTSWSLYFYGGRYPLLGEMLEPSLTAAPFTPPPSFPSDDDTSGPDFPLNPQPAT
jgi:hypothetical protein